MDSNRLHKPGQQAFSLIEMMAVLAIVAIAVGMGTIKMQPPRPGHAAKLAAGLIQATRSEAISNASRGRVAVCVDAGAGVHYLRQLVTLIDSDRDSTTEDWRIISVNQLPEGTCLRRDFSSVSSIMNISTLGPLEIQTGDQGSRFAYIEFDGLGHCESSAQWIFARAVFDAVEPVYPQEMDRDGFILRKTGKIAWFKSPIQIKRSISGQL